MRQLPDPMTHDQIERGIEDLHRRHVAADQDGVAKYYASDRGYYPPAEVGPERELFGIGITTVRGETYHVGDWEVPFALQSISKVFVHALALADHGRAAVLRRVGVEPSGDAFNSLVMDEHHNRPFNPMVNAGALATTALIEAGETADGQVGQQAARLQRILGVLRGCADNEDLAVHAATLTAELRGADRNRAAVYLMRADGMLEGDVEATLSLYLQQCSVQVTCGDLATMAATLANAGVNPTSGHRVLSRAVVRDVVSVMYTCGMYDYAGEWAYSVGVPAKSGVSGGLLVVIPGRMGIGIFSPGLDRSGNSVRGTRVCEELSQRLGLHVFGSEAEDHLLQPR